jgi:hypothetical protein
MATQDFKGTMNGVLPNQIIGDGTAGRVLRCSLFAISNGSAANTIKVEILPYFNGDVQAVSGDIGKGTGAVNGFSLNAGGTILTIDNTAVTGDWVGVLMGNLSVNTTGTAVFIRAYGTTTAYILAYDHVTGAALDFTALVDGGTGYLQALILYLTSA